MPEPRENELIERARVGDAEALEALLERYEPQIFRFGMKMCSDPEDAKDVLQETMLAAVRSLPDFRGGSTLSTWLYSIARSFCIKKRRKSKFAPDSIEPLSQGDDGEGPPPIDPSPGPEEEAHKRQLEDALRRAIAALDEGQREVLVLRDVEGLTAPEVASVLGISAEAVKSRLHRARVAIRAELAPMLEADESPIGRPAAAGEGCPDVLTLMSQHEEGEISSDACAELERHLDRCDKCKRSCDSMRHALALCRSSRAPRVPNAVQERVRAAIREMLAAEKR